MSIARLRAYAGVAPARATLRAANAQPNSSPKSLGFGLSPTPPSGFAAGRQGRRFGEPQKLGPFVLGFSGSPPAVSATSPDELQSAAWGGGELRDPMGRRSSAQSTAPILRPVSASLRLRFRSAALFARLRDSFYIRLTAKRVKSLFRRAGDGVFAHDRVF